MQTKADILVIGLGNPILGDDGVGWRVAEAVQRDLNGCWGVAFEYLSLGGLALMEHMVGFRDVVVVDSIVTGAHPQGTVFSQPLSSLPVYSSGHTSASHDTSLQTALELGRALGCVLPQEVWVVAVEAEHVYDFSDRLSPRIARAVPHAVEKVKGVLAAIVERNAFIQPA